MNEFPTKVRIVEVGARDGLQNQTQEVDVNTKIELIERLCSAGIQHIEAGAFVSPKWVPLMANSKAVLNGLKRHKNVVYSTLTPNKQGMLDAIDANTNEVAVFIAASETFSKKNTNCTISEAIDRTKPVIDLAAQHNIQVRGYVSCVMGCPYEGDEIKPEFVAELTAKLIALGCYEVSLGDTIGRGTPKRTQTLIDACKNEVPVDKLAVHFHDTYGQALVNIYAALAKGIAVIDSSIAGLGGCPYAKGATGNVATEDVVYMLDGLGIDTGVDLEKLIDVASYVSNIMGIANNSNCSNAMLKTRSK